MDFIEHTVFASDVCIVGDAIETKRLRSGTAGLVECRNESIGGHDLGELLVKFGRHG